MSDTQKVTNEYAEAEQFWSELRFAQDCPRLYDATLDLLRFLDIAIDRFQFPDETVKTLTVYFGFPDALAEKWLAYIWHLKMKRLDEAKTIFPDLVKQSVSILVHQYGAVDS